MKVTTKLTLLGLLISPNAFAYLGPGMGGGAIAAVLGLIGAIFLGIFSILYYPIKRKLLGKRARVQKEQEQEQEQE